MARSLRTPTGDLVVIENDRRAEVLISRGYTPVLDEATRIDPTPDADEPAEAAPEPVKSTRRKSGDK